MTPLVPNLIWYADHEWRYSHLEQARYRYVYTRTEGDLWTGKLHCLFVSAQELFAGRWPVDQYTRDLAVAPGL